MQRVKWWDPAKSTRVRIHSFIEAFHMAQTNVPGPIHHLETHLTSKENKVNSCRYFFGRVDFSILFPRAALLLPGAQRETEFIYVLFHRLMAQALETNYRATCLLKTAECVVTPADHNHPNASFYWLIAMIPLSAHLATESILRS